MMLIPLEEARKKIEELSFTPKVAEVDLLEAVGHLVVEDIYSEIDIPATNVSAMDGFAINVKDSGKKLKIAGKVYPSTKEVPKLKEGEAYYVTTGAPIPEGANCVVRVEGAKVIGDYLEVGEKTFEGKDIVRKGDNVKKGELIIRRGEEVRPYHLGILSYQRKKRLRVLDLSFAVFANGDEIVEMGKEGEGIPDSISPILFPLLRHFGRPVYLGVARDREDSVVEMMKKAIEHDFVISIGGSSMGEKDYVKRVIERMGRLLFEGVSVNVIKRGGVGLIQGKPVLVLPGQVVSAVTSFHEFGLGLISRFLGVDVRRYEEVELAIDVEVNHKMDSVYLFYVDGGKAFPLRWGVGLYNEINKANAFGVLKRGIKYRKGDKVIVQRLL
ncbi:MAG: molybdenum cofactor synthesis domain-containing protein [Candidatus Aramenus sulfurataquae]|uniref:Molybdenum cofactor synthesis domain-containing protein n=1 Tax=Candidatus Aramenus sulfurataquae TaxID=1326980 RepID=W7L8N1_9CREN|nr:MAG: molybdenum cofactor synthesis domain-containing protein [Candidatus Aramenus sulfurataquae]